MLALLVFVYWPAQAHTRVGTHVLGCLGNLRSLVLGWQMFADDHAGRLPPNGPDLARSWVGGFLDFSPANRYNLDSSTLLDPRISLLGPYTRDAAMYRCPGDGSQVRTSTGAFLPRVRSYSMNAALGTGAASWLPSPPYRSYQRLADLVSPPPAQLWVLLDEHPDSINDGSFAVAMPSSPPQTRWVDYPAAWHNGGAVLGFADGRAEMHRWVDPRTKPAPRYNNTLPLNVPSPSNPDVLWLAARTSSRAP